MLKSALNALTRMHSREAQLRRPGSPDIYSPCRVTPANYFRFLEGPSSTTIHGREFIIPIDTMLGEFAQTVEFEKTPVSGAFKFSYNGNLSASINYDATSGAIQTALRALPGLSAAVVIGSIPQGLLVTFSGMSSQPLILIPADSTLADIDSENVTITVTQAYQAWTRKIKKADKLLDPNYGPLTVDEVIEMPDLGGSTMAFRVRCE